MVDQKIRENRLRRVAQRRGMRLLKSRARDPLAVGYGGYMIVSTTGAHVAGELDSPLALTLDEVDEHLNGGANGLLERALDVADDYGALLERTMFAAERSQQLAERGEAASADVAFLAKLIVEQAERHGENPPVAFIEWLDRRTGGEG
ncbi:hypothetical protein [Amycolatopsis sp. NPDC004625]|uniref:hypothetical protein n=1 Tax=Amycolatopsis sp. NPDC004625 TaxID=3154670 RepID=UPI0033A53325